MPAHRRDRTVAWKPLFRPCGAKRQPRPACLQMTGTVGMRGLTCPRRLANWPAMRHQSIEAPRPIEGTSPYDQQPNQVLLAPCREQSLTNQLDSPKRRTPEIVQVIHDNSARALSRTTPVFRAPFQIGSASPQIG